MPTNMPTDDPGELSDLCERIERDGVFASSLSVANARRLAAEVRRCAGKWSCDRCRTVWADHLLVDIKGNIPGGTKAVCPRCSLDLYSEEIDRLRAELASLRRTAANNAAAGDRDAGEKAWVDDLEPLGFKFTACGTAMHFTYGTWSILVTGDFGHAEGWEKPTGLALEVSFATAAGKVTPHLSIMDDPTAGDVKRLLAALGLPTRSAGIDRPTSEDRRGE